MSSFAWPILLSVGISSAVASTAGLHERVEHAYADNDGVRIHYVSIGEGPLVIMIHGFPDFWYTWRNQMDAIAETHRVVAIDMRGYNLSDSPDGVDSYAMQHLVADVAAVLRHTGAETATIVGHDWGGMVSWQFAFTHPELTERLAILNLPHPRGLMRELATNPRQQENSQYARDFQKPDAHIHLSAEGLAGWVDEDARPRYVEAFGRSDFEAMLNYYKANYPREPYTEDSSPVVKLKMPVLMFHGLDDPYLLHDALNHTWEWLERDLTLVTIPGANHFVQHDAADLVTAMMRAWLNR